MKNYFSLLILLLVSMSSAYAVDKYWRPTDTNYHEATNWDPIGVPGAGDRVIFDSAGNSDCVISSSVSVGGWLQFSNYTTSVFLNGGATLTVGSQNFFMDSGGFIGGDGTIDCNGHFEVHGGGFDSPLGSVAVQGNFEIDPWPLGGWFVDNGNAFILDGFQAGTLISNVSIKNLEFAKAGGWAFNIPAGMELFCTNFCELTSGLINGGGTLDISGDCYVGPSHTGGVATIECTGSNNPLINVERTNWPARNFCVNVPSNDTLLIQSPLANFQFLTAVDTMRIKGGTAHINYFDTWHFQQFQTVIEPGGTLLAPPGDLRVSGNWVNNGGTFKHNNGSVYFDETTYTTMELVLQETFYNLAIDKPVSRTLTLEPFTQVLVENKFTSIQGLVQGPDARMLIEDSLILTPTHAIGTAAFEMVSSKTGNVILNNTGNFFNDFEINKTGVNDSVYFETENASLIIGDGINNRLDVVHGIAAFKDYGSQVNWNLANTEIHSGGQLEAPDGTILFSGNLTESGGTFDHNFGHFVFDETTYRALDVSGSIEFWNVGIDKPVSRTLTLGDGDELIALNRYESVQGLLQNANGKLSIRDTLIIQPTHTRGTAPIEFNGTLEGNWIVNESGPLNTNIRIEKSDPSIRVMMETENAKLDAGNFADEDLFIGQGILAFQNVGTHVDLDFRNVYVEAGGTFEAYSGLTEFGGSLIETGGEFDHNSGDFWFNETQYTNLQNTHPTEFWNITMDKAVGRSVTLGTGDSLVALNNYRSKQGLIQNAAGSVLVRDTAIFESTHIRGTAPITFDGPLEGNCIVNDTGPLNTDIRINKSDPATRVWMESDLANLQAGNFADETLTIEQGILGFQNVGSHVNLDFLNVNIEPLGTLEAYSGTTRFGGNLERAGGTFLHNSGSWYFDETQYTSLTAGGGIEFWNVIMDKPSGRSLTLASGDSLIAVNKYRSTQGLIENAGASINVRDTALFEPTHSRGTAPITFDGSLEGNCIINDTGPLNADIRINKSDPATRVWMESDLANLQTGTWSDEILTIEQGILGFQNVGSQANLDFLGVYIEPQGTLEAYSGTLRFGGSLYRVGGTFLHNSGNWHFDETRYTNLSAGGNIEFWNVFMDKASGRTLTLASGDTLCTENKYTSIKGGLQNANARLSIKDSLIVAATHGEGTALCIFEGPKPGTWIHDETGPSFSDVSIEKDTGVEVEMISSNTNLVCGSTGETVRMKSGILSLNQSTGFVAWNWEFTNIEGGTWRLNPGLTHFPYNFDFSSGNLDHNNGQVLMNVAYYKTWNLLEEPIFNDLEINIPSGRNVTIGAGQGLRTEGLLDFVAGASHGGELRANGDVDVQAAYGGGTSALVFEGSGDQFFDLTGATSRYEGFIEMDKTTGNVVLTSDLSIEDNFAQLVFTNGNLEYQDPTLQRVTFQSGVVTGWSGGSDDSYLNGPAIKIGSGTLDLPLGHDGYFAPLGFENLSPASVSVEARYLHVSPPAGPLGAGLDHVSACEQWTVTPLSGTPNGRVRLNYNSDRCGLINDEPALRVASWDGGTWNDKGQSTADGSYLTSALVPTNWIGFTLASFNTNNPMNATGIPCPFDLDGSGSHDTGDLLMLLGQFGCSSGCSNDLTGDDAVDTADLLALLGVFGTPCP